MSGSVFRSGEVIKYRNDEAGGGGGGGVSVVAEEILSTVLPDVTNNIRSPSAIVEQNKVTTTYGDGSVIVQHRVGVLMSIMDTDSPASMQFAPNAPFPPHTFGDGQTCRAVFRGEVFNNNPMYVRGVLAANGRLTVFWEETGWGRPATTQGIEPGSPVNYNGILDFFYKVA